MTRIIVSILGISVLLLLTGVFASNSPAFATSGTATGSSFGALSSGKYVDGLKINGKIFDISNHTQTIPTQTLLVNHPSTMTLKIYHTGTPKSLLHLVIYLNLKGTHPHPIQSDTWIDYSKFGNVAVHDPHKIFQSITAKTTYDTQYMYINFAIITQKPMDTSHMIIRTWDTSKKMTEVDVLNAIKVSYH